MSDKENPRAAGPVDRKIGARIRARRLERDLSQERLAELIGVTFQQVQKYEKGLNRVAASTLMDIARALEVSAASLLPTTKSDVEDSGPLDNPEIADFARLLQNLNSDGKRTLADIARTLAKDPKLGKRKN